MNVLILTPDAVGSTLLQRLITIYMQFHHYDRPVINLHELTNGLIKYYNSHFEMNVLGKPKDRAWGYYQTLNEVVDLLHSVDHYKTSRLAQYHIKNRQDSLDQQIPFYQYLNDNFYIISCRRHNVFEHALSWCITKITKKLNVYNSQEKIDSFFEIYRDGIDIDPNSLIHTLNAYRDYINWCNNHFNVANYFYYDEHLPKIEQFILSLPVFSNQPQKLGWDNKFGMEFDNWNRCHHVTSDLGLLALNNPTSFAQLVNESSTIKQQLSTEFSESDQRRREEEFIKNYKDVADPSWPVISTVSEYRALPQHIRDEVEKQHNITLRPQQIPTHVQLSQTVESLLPVEYQEFYKNNQEKYRTASLEISTLVNQGVLISPPPIKKQTLAEKKYIIKNYQHCLDVYNQWIEKNPDIGQPLDNTVLDQFADMESKFWQGSILNTDTVDLQKIR